MKLTFVGLHCLCSSPSACVPWLAWVSTALSSDWSCTDLFDNYRFNIFSCSASREIGLDFDPHFVPSQKNSIKVWRATLFMCTLCSLCVATFHVWPSRSILKSLAKNRLRIGMALPAESVRHSVVVFHWFHRQSSRTQEYLLLDLTTNQIFFRRLTKSKKLPGQCLWCIYFIS